MRIHDVILEVSSQEPSASSKYDIEDGRGVLEVLLIMLELKFGTQIKKA